MSQWTSFLGVPGFIAKTVTDDDDENQSDSPTLFNRLEELERVRHVIAYNARVAHLISRVQVASKQR